MIFIGSFLVNSRASGCECDPNNLEIIVWMTQNFGPKWNLSHFLKFKFCDISLTPYRHMKLVKQTIMHEDFTLDSRFFLVPSLRWFNACYSLFALAPLKEQGQRAKRERRVRGTNKHWHLIITKGTPKRKEKERS